MIGRNSVLLLSREDWRNSSTSKSTGRSCRESTWVLFPASKSDGSQGPLAPISEHLMPNSSLCGNCAYVVHMQTSRNIHIKNKYINFKNPEIEAEENVNVTKTI